MNKGALILAHLVLCLVAVYADQGNPIFSRQGIHTYIPSSAHDDYDYGYNEIQTNVCGKEAQWYASDACITTNSGDPSDYYYCEQIEDDGIVIDGACLDPCDTIGFVLSLIGIGDVSECYEELFIYSYAPLKVPVIYSQKNSYTPNSGIIFEFDFAAGAEYNMKSGPSFLLTAVPTVGNSVPIGYFDINSVYFGNFEGIGAIGTTAPGNQACSCNTYSAFLDYNIPSDGVSFELEFYNGYYTYEGTVIYFFNVKVNPELFCPWGSETNGFYWADDIVISEIRIIEVQDCYYHTSSIYSVGDGDNRVRAAIISTTGNYAVSECDVCAFNSGKTVCSSEINAEAFLTFTYTYDSTTGTIPTDGLLLLYGANLGPNTRLTVYINGEVAIYDSAPSRTLPPSLDGEYFFCSNCMYNTWIIPNGYLLNGANSFEIYSSGTDIICVAGWQIFMDVVDDIFPSVTTQSLTVNVKSNDLTPVSINIDQFITSQTDNCDSYTENNFLSLDSIISPTSVSIWDYPSTQVQLEYCDSQNNCEQTQEVVYITPNPFPITYPTGTGPVTFPIQNIIIRWANYAPIVNSKTLVNIWVEPGDSCGPNSLLVYLGQNVHYYLFELYYNDAVHNLVTVNSYPNCEYTLYLQFVGSSTSVTFSYSSVDFCDKDISC